MREVAESARLNCEISGEAVFRLFDQSGEIVGILALQVDDIISGGTPALYEEMTKVSEVMALGTEEFSEEGPFIYAGLRISAISITKGAHKGIFSFDVDGDQYLNAALCMDGPNGHDDDFLAPGCIFQFRYVAGTVGYISCEFRTDLSIECSTLSQRFLNPTIGDAKKVNATLAWAKANSFTLRYRPGAKPLLGFSDSPGLRHWGHKVDGCLH